MLNSWYCCITDTGSYELCKIIRRKIKERRNISYFEYAVITYYDGKELLTGDREKCQKWIDSHWIEGRYLDHVKH